MSSQNSNEDGGFPVNGIIMAAVIFSAIIWSVGLVLGENRDVGIHKAEYVTPILQR